jgi:anti-sigma regulatory factor (Ser/Thr protein kinase)
MHSDNGGRVIISFELFDDYLKVTVEDNGVGRENAMRYSQKNGADPHQSRGIEVTNKRLIAMRSKNKTTAGVEVVDLKNSKGEAAGTRVTVSIPL